MLNPGRLEHYEENAMNEYKTDLIRAINSMRKMGDDYPVWLDGLFNVLARGETSHLNDNPYMPFGTEASNHAQYQIGAEAGEKLLKALGERDGN